MSYILNIDTSLETASVSIAENAMIIAAAKNDIQKEHAGFLHIAIKEISAQASFDLKNIDAIAVTNGPGSYTGLRVGMASAKGLCYALNKPLITVGNLNALAFASISKMRESVLKNALFCPMIDARRMEVFTSIYDQEMVEILAPCAMLLNTESFINFSEKNQIVFSGSGALKWSKIAALENSTFLFDTDITEAISKLSYKKFKQGDFTDLKYSEPLYVKEFFLAS